MEQHTCKNCGQTFEGNFCNVCGQPADTHRISLHVLWHDIQHGFFHFDNGIFYTAKQLFIRPGHTIREYLEGKRVRHFKPISLIIILATLYGFLAHYFHVHFVSSYVTSGGIEQLSNAGKAISWVDSHFAAMVLTQLPLYTIASYWMFKRQGYNFLEHLILNAFSSGQRIIFHIVMVPILHVLDGTPAIIGARIFMYAVDLVLMVWTYAQFFNKIRPFKAVILTLFAYGFVSLLFYGVGWSAINLGAFLSEAGKKMLERGQ